MQKISLLKSFTILPVLLTALVFRMLPCGAQTNIAAVVSDPAPFPGSHLEITLTLDGECDLYYAETEISFDPDILEFVSVLCTGLTQGGISIGGELQHGLTGASVSRTGPLAEPADGPFMLISFMVRIPAMTGTTVISFSDPVILDSAGEIITAGTVDPSIVDIQGSVTYAGLTGPGTDRIDEGELYHVEAAVFASGITDNGRVVCQVGVSPDDTDPGSWDEELWSDMLFEGSDENHHLRYSAEIAFMRPPGEWHIAVRSALDGGEYVYGGSQGLWHPDESPSVRLGITARPPYRYTVAKWDFDDRSYSPSLSLPGNAGSHVALHGATLQGFSPGASGLSANSNGWDGGSDGSKYWYVDISATGVGSLKLSSKQSGSNTGPRDFIIEYSTDGESWFFAEGSEITVGSNWSTGVLDDLPLPAGLNGMEGVLLRWAMISETSISGGTVGTAGTGRIDDIVITGINPDPVTIEVYPGDTNNDGVVNADDVLPLGLWWLYRGPPSVWVSGDFEPRSTEQWITPNATRADTNGDGVVDHRDLAAVGFHFGKSAGGVTKDSAGPLSSVIIDPGESGSRVGLMLATAAVTSLRGISFSISVNGISPGMWGVSEAYQAFAGKADNGDIIDFEIMHNGIYEAAFTLRGQGEDRMSNILAGIEIVVPEWLSAPFTVELSRATIIEGSGNMMPATGAMLVPAGIVGTEPVPREGSGPAPGNYPNPFTSITTIPFRMPSAGSVRIEVYDLIGRLVSVPLDAFLPEGLHEVLFDGSDLLPGIYPCRLTVPGRKPEVMLMIRTE